MSEAETRAACATWSHFVSLLVDQLLDPCFTIFIASHSQRFDSISQLVKPAHTEQGFMHGLFMFKNVFLPSFLVSDIVCIFFTFQGYSVGVLSHPPRDL